MQESLMLTRHFEESADVDATADEVFAFVDDHRRLSAHMMTSSGMMGGGRMSVEFDEGQGRALGSHIRMRGSVCGVSVFLDEVVTRREPSTLKAWSTVGAPKLIVIGSYTMGVAIAAAGLRSTVTMFIDYELPTGLLTRVLGWLFGGMYAKWCVRQMLAGIVSEFRVPGVEKTRA